MSKEKLLELVKADPELLAYVTQIEESASKADKMKTLNDSIVSERDGLKKTIKDLEEKTKNGTNTVNDDAVLNAMKAKVEELTGKIDGLVKERDTAVSDKKATDLKNSIVSAASTHKALKPDDLFVLMQAKKLVGYDDNGNAFYHKINAAGQPEATTAEEAIKAIKVTDPNYFGAAAAGGVGSTPSTATGPAFDPKAWM